jgi:hypothetical protein
MPTLMSDVALRHAALLQLLRIAAHRAAPAKPGEARMNTDRFLAQASRHAAASAEVLLPLVARHLDAGRTEVRDYLRAARGLEHTLARAKAREYGQAQAAHLPWATVWTGVGNQLARTIAAELRLAAMLCEHLGADDDARLRERFRRAVAAAPTRPHPHLPHTGIAGTVARNLCAKLDALWDEVEGRITSAA